MEKLQENAKLATAASTQLLAAANGAERCNGEYKLFLKQSNIFPFDKNSTNFASEITYVLCNSGQYI